MYERGFFCAGIGYWQTIGEPSEDLRASYPEGTVEVPIMPGPGYEWNGAEWTCRPIEIDFAVLFETARLLVNGHVDTVARVKGYNDGAACASYVASTNATWAAEAVAFIAWRDAVWSAVFALRDQALSGVIETLPGGDELIAGLPVMNWPT